MRLSKQKSVKLLLPVVALAAFLMAGYLFAYQVVFAATGSIYITPASVSLSHGATVKLSLRIDPGTTVSGVKATINYDSTKLKFISVDKSGSAFAADLPAPMSAGSIGVARGDFSGGVSADSLIESVTFQSLVYSGSTSVTLSDANAAWVGSYTYPAAVGSSVTLTPGSCPAGQTGTPPSCTTPQPTGGGGIVGGSTGPVSSGSAKTSPSSTPKPTANTPAPTVAPAAPAPTAAPSSPNAPVVTAKKVGFTSVEFAVTTAQPAQVYLEYGLSRSLGQQTALDAAGLSHSVLLGKNVVTPGLTYYYQLVAKAADGSVVKGPVQSVHSKGMNLRVQILDASKQPIKNQPVTLHSEPMTATTDSKGYALFNDVTPGTHEVQYTTGNRTYSSQLTVANNILTKGTLQTAPLQNFSVVYNYTPSSAGGKLAPIIITLLIVVLAGAGTLLWRRRQNGRPNKIIDHAGSMTAVVGNSHSSSTVNLLTKTKTDPTVSGSAPAALVSAAAQLSNFDHFEQASKPQPTPVAPEPMQPATPVFRPAANNMTRPAVRPPLKRSFDGTVIRPAAININETGEVNMTGAEPSYNRGRVL